MAKYRITGPDGGTYEITAPDSATQEQVLAYAQQNYGGKTQQPPQPVPEVDMAQIARQTYDESPWHERIAISAGGALNSLGRGIGQILTPDDSDIGRRLQASVDADAPYQEGMHGATNIIGQALPYLATIPLGGPEAAVLSRIPQAGKLAQLGAKVGTAAAEGAGYGAAQETATGASRLENAGMGALGGGLARGAVSAVGAPFRALAQEADPYVQALADKARGAGIKLGAGELSANPLVRTVVSQMERLPFSGGAARSEANREAFTQAVGNTFGAQGNKLTPDVYANAKSSLGAEFERLTANNSLEANPQLVTTLATIANSASKNGTADASRVIGNRVDEFMNDVMTGNGSVNGRRYQALDTDLGQQIQQFRTSDPSAAFHLAQLREALRGAMDDSISPADKAAWREVRAKWGNMKTVEPLVGKSADGTISPASLMQRVNVGAGAGRMATGRSGELGDLARIGQRFLKDAPNSGTADRNLVNNMVTHPISGIATLGLLPLSLLANRVAVSTLNRAPNSSKLAALLADQGVGATVRRGAERGVRKLTVPNMPRSEGLDIDVRGGTPKARARADAEYRRIIEEAQKSR